MSADLTHTYNWIRYNAEKCEFKVPRKAFVDTDILKMEREKIFDTCWLYLGHESEIPHIGDYKTRKVGGRPIIFIKGTDGEIRALINSCTHRGALVCRDNEGNSKTFQCFYHAWTFDNQGTLVGQPGALDGYPQDYNCDGAMNLKQAPRIENYRGLYFINFDPDACSLPEYLGAAKEYLDLVLDQSEVAMEVTGGTQKYSIRANWKLLYENSADSYHAIPTHKTYFDYLESVNGKPTSKKVSHGTDLGNGHAVMEYKGRNWGRPVARWVPTFGEDLKDELDTFRRRLEERFGPERAERMAEWDRNLLIFPNFVVNDIMAVTLRTFYPVNEGYMEVSAWALVPKESSPKHREKALAGYLEFLGPGGFATPDDVEALELCQEGFAQAKEVKWNDISKGMIKELKGIPTESHDETQMRAFWKQWDRIMSRER